MESDSANGPPGFIDLPADNLLAELQNIPNPSASQPVLCISTNQETGEINIVTEKSTNEQPPASEDGSVLTPVAQKLNCSECGRFNCYDADKMLRHIRKVHRGENPFQCTMCDYSTYNKVVFEEHVRIHKGIKPFKCRYCPHRSVSKKNLKRHEHIHRPDNPLKCPHCDHIARHKKGFECHASKCHPIKPDMDTLSCNLCSKVFDSEEKLILHTTKVRTCDHLYKDFLNKEPRKCAFSACSRKAMNEHKAKHERARERVSSKKNIWKCALCAWSSYSERMILLHLIHHPDQAVDETRIDVSILRKHGIMA